MERYELTGAMEKALLNALRGRQLSDGLKGRSAHGGLSKTVLALRRRGLLDRQNRITERGTAALYHGGHEDATPAPLSE